MSDIDVYDQHTRAQRRAAADQQGAAATAPEGAQHAHPARMDAGAPAAVAAAVRQSVAGDSSQLQENYELELSTRIKLLALSSSSLDSQDRATSAEAVKELLPIDFSQEAYAGVAPRHLVDDEPPSAPSPSLAPLESTPGSVPTVQTIGHTPLQDVEEIRGLETAPSSSTISQDALSETISLRPFSATEQPEQFDVTLSSRPGVFDHPVAASRPSLNGVVVNATGSAEDAPEQSPSTVTPSGQG